MSWKSLLALLAVMGLIIACGEEPVTAPASPGGYLGEDVTPVPTLYVIPDLTNPILKESLEQSDGYICRWIRIPEGGRPQVQLRPFDFGRHGLEEAPEGRRMLYKYDRLGDENGQLTSSLTCIIPATQRSVDWFHDLLEVPEDAREQAVSTGAPLQSGPLSSATRHNQATAAEYPLDMGSIYVVVSPTEPEECDPYLELDFSCDGGGECATSIADGSYSVVLAGCGGGGGGTGGGTSDPKDGGDSGGDSPLPPDVELAELDMAGDTIIPLCDEPPPDDATARAAQTAYCNSRSMTGDTAVWIDNAVDRIAERGGPCGLIANQAHALLAQQMLRIYDGNLTPRFLGFGDDDLNIAVIAAELTQCRPGYRCVSNTPGGTFEPTLDWAIVHEVEHTLGGKHVDGTYNLHTPNSPYCGGLK